MGFFAVLAASLFFVFLFTVFGGYSLLLWCQQSLWMIVPPALVLAVLIWTFLKMDDKITALQKRVDELLRPLPAPQSGSERDHVAALDLILHRVQRRRTKPPVHLRQRKGHCGDTFGCLDGPDGLRHPQRHQPAAGPCRRRRGEIGRAGVAHRAAYDQQLSKGPFMAVQLSLRQRRFQKIQSHRPDKRCHFHGQSPFFYVIQSVCI